MPELKPILLVEDNPKDLELTLAALEQSQLANEVVVVRDGELQARNTMELTLTCDHRILYGAEAAEFLARIRERLEQPLMLAL